MRFRAAKNIASAVTERQSECFHVPVDLWKRGMGRVMVVPRARCARRLSLPIPSPPHSRPTLSCPQSLHLNLSMSSHSLVSSFLFLRLHTDTLLSVAYSGDDYAEVCQDGGRLPGTKHPAHIEYRPLPAPGEETQIRWVREPPAQVLYHDYAWWHETDVRVRVFDMSG